MQLLGNVELVAHAQQDDADHSGHDRGERRNRELRVFQPFRIAAHVLALGKQLPSSTTVSEFLRKRSLRARGGAPLSTPVCR
jgi:hypothetical protein